MHPQHKQYSLFEAVLHACPLPILLGLSCSVSPNLPYFEWMKMPTIRGRSKLRHTSPTSLIETCLGNKNNRRSIEVSHIQ